MWHSEVLGISRNTMKHYNKQKTHISKSLLCPECKTRPSWSYNLIKVTYVDYFTYRNHPVYSISG